jgi:hypothetical protein
MIAKAVFQTGIILRFTTTTTSAAFYFIDKGFQPKIHHKIKAVMHNLAMFTLNIVIYVPAYKEDNTHKCL